MLEYRDRYIEEILGITDDEDFDDGFPPVSPEDIDSEGEKKAPFVAIGLVIGALLFIPASLLGMKLLGVGLLGASVLISAFIGSAS